MRLPAALGLHSLFRTSASIKLLKDEHGVIAIVYALSLLPLVVVIALAVDFGFYVLAQSQLNLAADAAALQAVRVAEQTYLDYSSTTAQAIAAGQAAGQQWFNAQLGTIGFATVLPANINVQVTYQSPSQSSTGSFSASVAYSGTVATNVGAFLLPSWPISNTAWNALGAEASQSPPSYLEVIMMLDNSSSMLIGATLSDIELMMRITPCSSVNAVSGSNTASLYPYSMYQCDTTFAHSGSTTWSTVVSALNLDTTQWVCPLGASSITLPSKYISGALTPVSATLPTSGAACQKAGACGASCGTSGSYQGDPCAFACHSDSSNNDNYGTARSTVGTTAEDGTSLQITLRLDVLKTATNTLLSNMQSTAAVSGNISVGIFTFNSTLTQIYPSSGEAGTEFTTAINDVGIAPTTQYPSGTGIQPEVTTDTTNHDDTDFYGTMTSLANKLTASGDGSSITSPRKVIFLVTDGYQDYDSTGIGPIDVTRCTNFKNMGYTIYVLYTPYYPLMHDWYFYNNAPNFTSGAVTANLQSCASSSSDYIEASDLTSITAAMQKFLASAEGSAAKIAE